MLGHVGVTFFLADNFFKDSPSFTFERSHVHFSHIPVGLEISSHFVSAPISPLVTYVTSCPPQYGILEVIWRVESEKRNMRDFNGTARPGAKSRARTFCLSMYGNLPPEGLASIYFLDGTMYIFVLRSRVMRDVRKTVMNITLAP